MKHFGLSDNSWEDPAHNPAKTESGDVISSSEYESEDECTFYLVLMKS